MIHMQLKCRTDGCTREEEERRLTVVVVCMQKRLLTLIDCDQTSWRVCTYVCVRQHTYPIGILPSSSFCASVKAVMVLQSNM